MGSLNEVSKKIREKGFDYLEEEERQKYMEAFGVMNSKPRAEVKQYSLSELDDMDKF